MTMTNESPRATYSMTKIVFFGTGPVAAASLDYLATLFEIEAVITKPRAHGYKGSVPVEKLCAQRQFPVYFTANKTELDTILQNNSFSSTCGVVVDFGIIITQFVIDSFQMGIVNSHFSLLPQWRGADPITYTILSGQPKTGVSLMVIDAGLDTGKLITQRTITVDVKETTATLTGKLITLSNLLLSEYLPLYINGEIRTKSQPHPDRVTHSHKIAKSDARIDWNTPAVEIERKIRAFIPWPKARAMIGVIDCILIDANVTADTAQSTPGTIDVGTKSLIVNCSERSLSIATIQPLGKKEMPIQAFLAGYRSQLTD